MKTNRGNEGEWTGGTEGASSAGGRQAQGGDNDDDALGVPAYNGEFPHFPHYMGKF